MSDQESKQRRAIDPSEFSNVTPDQVRTFQRQSNPEAPQSAPQATLPPVREGMQVKGRLPPAMEEILRQRIQETTEDAQPAERPERPQPSVAPMPMPVPRMVSSQDPALDELIAGLKSQHYEPITLPSRGRFYKSSDLSGGVLHVRTITGKDEQFFATQRFVRQNMAMNAIFSSCIKERIDPQQLLMADRTYLLIYLRGISYGPHYDAVVPCKECGHNFEQTFNLDTLRTLRCPDDFSEEQLTKKLPMSGYTFTYRLPTGKDDADVNEYRDRMSRGFPDRLEDSFYYRASLLITSITNGNVVVENQGTIKSLLEKMPVGDTNYIRNILNNDPFGVDTKITVYCPSCFAEFETELPYDHGFFFPRNREEVTAT